MPRGDTDPEETIRGQVNADTRRIYHELVDIPFNPYSDEYFCINHGD